MRLFVTRHLSPVTLFLSLVTLLALAGCGQPPAYKQQSYVFGTLVEVSVYGEAEAKARQAVDLVLREFDTLHRRLHAWEDGELGHLNAAFAHGPEPVAVADDLAAMLRDAAQRAAKSDGLFNPAIGNLVRLWGFHSDSFPPRQPARAEIERLLAAAPAMSDLVFSNGRVSSRNPAVRLDLGGYAKGYALDRAAALLREAKVKNALVNIGGNILALGSHGERPWRVGIQHPRKAGALASLDLADGEAIGTSGDYQRFFELDGRRYCHLIDPRTGWPVQGVQAVTVIARGAQAGVQSDVASKPLFVAGPGKWRDLAGRMGIEVALLVDGAGRVEVTAAMQRRLTWIGTQLDVTVVPRDERL